MRKYETPEMEVIQFQTADVIATSLGDGGESEISLDLGMGVEIN